MSLVIDNPPLVFRITFPRSIALYSSPHEVLMLVRLGMIFLVIPLATVLLYVHREPVLGNIFDKPHTRAWIVNFNNHHHNERKQVGRRPDTDETAYRSGIMQSENPADQKKREHQH